MSDDIITRTADAAAQWWTDRLESGDKDRFKEKLKELIIFKLQKYGRWRLECDYDPDEILLECVNYAGVECRGFLFSHKGILPQKHNLYITPGKLEPKEGYGNWTKDIEVL